MSLSPRSVVRSLLIALGVGLWAVAIFGTTQLHTLDLPLGPLEHGICGPWGCAAAPEALLGYHAFWAALLVPALGLVCRALPSDTARRVAWGAIGVGAVALVLMVGGASFEWLRDDGAARYALQRGLFVVATTPDVPAGPLLAAGLIGLLTTGRGRDHGEDRSKDRGQNATTEVAEEPGTMVSL